MSALSSTLNETDLELVYGYVPNPFQGIGQGTYLDSNSTLLTMVDGGENGIEVPLQPLLVKARGVDVIFASDAVSASLGCRLFYSSEPQSAQSDTNYPNGSSIMVSITRAIRCYELP